MQHNGVFSLHRYATDTRCETIHYSDKIVTIHTDASNVVADPQIQQVHPDKMWLGGIMVRTLVSQQ